MSIGPMIQAWRLFQKQSLESVSDLSGLSIDQLEQIEEDQVDPSVTTLQVIAAALRIPPAWLFDSPQSFTYLFTDSEQLEDFDTSQSDPVTVRILTGSRLNRSLYVLLTTLMEADDPKVLRTAEVSLRSLVKQSRRSAVSWQQRPSGHFEPPSD
ncbi:MAG: helix-turn-helix transcriptional regulator [Nitrospira sp.]|nr:helix-turn-helix transcriptional regulator [Nitrospira sp.]